jgi:hypothetical protein
LWCTPITCQGSVSNLWIKCWTETWARHES